MSTFLIPSPSLPHTRSLKIAALLNRLSLSFICHSPPPCSPLSDALFFIYSLFCCPPNIHITLALYTSMHCSAVISVYTFQLHLKPPYPLLYNKKAPRLSLYVPRLLLSLPYLISLFVHSLHRSRPMCSLHLSPSPPCSLHLFQTQGSYI